MTANKYLLIITICILLIYGMSNMLISSRTGSGNKESFEKAYKWVNMKTGGELAYLKVMGIKSSTGTADVFIVENLPVKIDGKRTEQTYQAGRMVPFIRDDKTDTWKPDWENQKLYWNDQRNKDNKFTFPPFIGRDKLVLFKQ